MFSSADLLRNCVFAWALSDSFRLSGSIILLASFNLLAITSAASFKSKQTHWRNQGTRISKKIGRFLTIGISQEITRVLSMDIWREFRRVLTSGIWIYGDILGKACLLFIFLSVAFLFSFGTAKGFQKNSALQKLKAKKRVNHCRRRWNVESSYRSEGSTSFFAWNQVKESSNIRLWRAGERRGGKEKLHFI